MLSQKKRANEFIGLRLSGYQTLAVVAPVAYRFAYRMHLERIGLTLMGSEWKESLDT
jgi:hypothetical protein